ncbi:MAG: UxaA family hydrolase [Peptococcaceae bacterium]
MAKKTIFMVSEQDNVATILKEGLQKGNSIELKRGENSELIELKDEVKYGHKIAVKPIKKGEIIKKYGLAIGVATSDINVGEHVHIHNVESKRGRGDLVQGR